VENILWYNRTPQEVARAEAAASLAAAAVPGNGEFLTTLGVTHFQVGHLAQAADVLERARAVGKDSDWFRARATGYLAMIHSQRGEHDQAVRELDALRDVAKSGSTGDDAPGGIWNFVAEVESKVKEKTPTTRPTTGKSK
jgi:cytochrome c-type biogenesis protein CcmH/NrfG